MADAVNGDALDRAQKIFNAMRDEPDSTGKLAVLAEALEQIEANTEAAMTKATPVEFVPPDGAVRVLRLLEYVYPDAEAMLADRQHWQVQGSYRPRGGHLIRSTVLPPEVFR